jgi:hypothetical protein
MNTSKHLLLSQIFGNVVTSLKGKITIVKSLALPQLLYVTNVVHVTEQFTTNVDKEIRFFCMEW